MNEVQIIIYHEMRGILLVWKFQRSEREMYSASALDFYSVWTPQSWEGLIYIYNSRGINFTVGLKLKNWTKTLSCWFLQRKNKPILKI